MAEVNIDLIETLSRLRITLIFPIPLDQTHSFTSEYSFSSTKIPTATQRVRLLPHSEEKVIQN